MDGRGAGMILHKAAAVLKKDALTSLRYRNGFVMNAVAPAVQLATFYYLSRAVGPQYRPEGMPYFVFLLVGTGFYTFLLSGMYSFLRSIQEAQQSGTLEVLMTTSTRPSTLLSLNSISAFASAFVQLLIYAGIGMVLFAPGAYTNVAAAVLVFTLSVTIAVAIGIIAATLQISIQKGSAVLWALGSCSWLMAGTLFPVSALPRPARVLSNLLPFTHSLTGMRLAMFQPSTSSVLQTELRTLALFAALLLPVSIAFFSWTVRRARQLGTLSYY
jgi:ABC-2 type transport system permease protein